MAVDSRNQRRVFAPPVHRDPIGDRELLLATELLDPADELASEAFGFELGIAGEIERHRQITGRRNCQARLRLSVDHEVGRGHGRASDFDTLSVDQAFDVSRGEFTDALPPLP